jgi:hypothetical protein
MLRVPLSRRTRALKSLMTSNEVCNPPCFPSPVDSHKLSASLSTSLQAAHGFEKRFLQETGVVDEKQFFDSSSPDSNKDQLRLTHSVCAVNTEMPYFLASVLNGVLVRTRSFRSSLTSLGVNMRSGGRPNRLPWLLACCSPAFTRSTISDLSHWAIAPMI